MWLYNRISAEIFDLIHQHGATAAEVWASICSLSLENHEHQEVLLPTKFRCMEQGSSSIITYFFRLKECAGRLADLGALVTDRDQVHNMLHSLHPRCHYAVPILTMQTPFLSLLRYRTFLLLEESHQSDKRSTKTALHVGRAPSNGSGGANRNGGGGRSKGKGKASSGGQSSQSGGHPPSHNGGGAPPRPAAPVLAPWMGMVHAWPMPWRPHAPGFQHPWLPARHAAPLRRYVFSPRRADAVARLRVAYHVALRHGATPSALQRASCGRTQPQRTCVGLDGARARSQRHDHAVGNMP